MRGARRRPVGGLLAALALLSGIAGCDGTTEVEATLRLVFDEARLAEFSPGESVQLSAFDAQGTVAFSSDNPGVATVVSRTGLVTAVASGSTTIRANDGTSEATVQVTVRAKPLIRLAEVAVEFEAIAGGADPAPASVAVTNGGELPLDGLAVDGVAYTGGGATGWLAATLGSSSAPTQLQITPSVAGLAPGTYLALITVSDPGAVSPTEQVAVTLRVLRPPSIELDRTSVELGTTPGQNSSTVAVALTNGGDAPLTGLGLGVSYPAGQPAGWVDASISGNQAPATLSIRALGAGLAEGQYSATVNVNSGLPGVASRAVAVTLTVAADATITLSRTDVDITAVVGQGNPGPETVQITNGGGGTLNQLSIDAVAYTSGPAGWLGAALSQNTAPASLVLTPDPVGAALGTGTYTATVTIRSPAADNSPRTVDVTLTVAEQPQIAINPTRGWTPFEAINGRGDPQTKPLQITNGGGGGDAALTGISVTVEYLSGDSDWLTVTPAGGTAPLTVQGIASSSAVAPGEHVARVTVSSSVPGVDPVSFNVTFRLAWSYELDIMPIWAADNCLGCHFSGGTFPNLQSPATSYAQLLTGTSPPLVTPGDPNTGDLVCKIIGQGPCVTGTDMRIDDLIARNRIREWIAQGAKY
jgi:hypothetical protein